MKKRLIGGAIIFAIVIPVFLIGGIVFDIFAGIVGALALYELINADKELKNIPVIVKILAFICVPLIGYINLNDSIYMGIDIYTIAIPMVLLLIPTLLFHKNGYNSKNGFKLSFIAIFVGFLVNLFVNIFNIDKFIFLWLILIGMSTDVFAYLGGKLFGKHKFSKISPNKTIEGCISGIIFGSLIGYIYYINMFNVLNGIVLLVVVILLSIIGEIGDLFYSLIKRDNDIKDFSHLIPGHGGICDRIDSLSFIILLYSILFRFL